MQQPAKAGGWHERQAFAFEGAAAGTLSILGKVGKETGWTPGKAESSAVPVISGDKESSAGSGLQLAGSAPSGAGPAVASVAPPQNTAKVVDLGNRRADLHQKLKTKLKTRSADFDSLLQEASVAACMAMSHEIVKSTHHMAVR